MKKVSNLQDFLEDTFIKKHINLYSKHKDDALLLCLFRAVKREFRRFSSLFVLIFSFFKALSKVRLG
jgi:hypothetical protein